jgi:hypothetical protein
MLIVNGTLAGMYLRMALDATMGAHPAEAIRALIAMSGRTPPGGEGAAP